MPATFYRIILTDQPTLADFAELRVDESVRRVQTFRPRHFTLWG